MFIDETILRVAAGNGGNGCYSYEHEKYKPQGRPNGGNGGNGGDIIIKASTQVHTLQDVAYRKTITAGRGTHGKGSLKTGPRGEDMIILVPLGTVIIDEATEDILCECITDNFETIIAKGGRGGRGNAALANSHNPNPQTIEEGKPGEQKTLRFVLKVLADIGLVGRPNAGKSTFLSVISHAHPKIADYPFTTTEPHLGIVKRGYDTFVVADIPGLIEGSHLGKGLGIRFLKHIERTRILAIMVESTSEDPLGDAKILLSELSQYSERLAQKPCCFLLTKCDISSEIQVPKGWFAISSATNQGVDTVLTEFSRIIADMRKQEEPEEVELPGFLEV
jgi:GTP-binding protein